MHRAAVEELGTSFRLSLLSSLATNDRPPVRRPPGQLNCPRGAKQAHPCVYTTAGLLCLHMRNMSLLWGAILSALEHVGTRHVCTVCMRSSEATMPHHLTSMHLRSLACEATTLFSINTLLQPTVRCNVPNPSNPPALAIDHCVPGT